MAVPDSLRAEVDRILSLDLSSSESQAAGKQAVSEILNALGAEVGRVEVEAGDYPATVISAAVWMDGAACANMACALTQHFHAAGWLSPEEFASRLWAKATLAVCSHYRNLVGPAMLANADCHERQGNTAYAAQMYDAGVKDFACTVNDWYGDGGIPHDDDRTALESLRTALERSLALAPQSPDRDSWQHLLLRTTDILARPRDG